MPNQGVAAFDAAALRAARERLGLSQGSLAKAIGVRPGAVNSWETGRHLPVPRRIVQLADALGLDPAVLTQTQIRPTLRELRQAVGLSGYDIEDRGITSATWLFGVERGEQPLSATLRRGLAEAYGVDAAAVQAAYDRMTS